MNNKHRILAYLTGAAAALAVNGASAAVIISEDFNTGIPATWTVVDDEGNGVVWSDLAGCGEPGNFTNGSADVACVSSDIFGTAEFDTSLTSPAFSLAGVSNPTLTYTANYQNFAFLDFLDVDISSDGGSSWTNLLSWNEDHGAFRNTPGENVSIPLGAYAGSSSLQLRWRYYDPNTGDEWDWYAQIDNVLVQGDGNGTVPEPGTLTLMGLGLAGLGYQRRRRPA